MKHLYKLFDYDGNPLPDIQADDWHRNGDFNVFVDDKGKEVARVAVVDVAVINTTAA